MKANPPKMNNRQDSLNFRARKIPNRMGRRIINRALRALAVMSIWNYFRREEARK
jgi:hypothetical protein